MATAEPFNRSDGELTLDRFHRCLNSAAYVPPRAYRRNSNLYPLVCYVNTLVAATLSENYEVLPLFVARAAEHMAEVQPSAEAANYYALVSAYLAHLVYHTKAAGVCTEFDVERIPASILEAGPQQAPDLLQGSPYSRALDGLR